MINNLIKLNKIKIKKKIKNYMLIFLIKDMYIILNL